VTVSQLKAYVGAPTSDDTFVTACWDEASALVAKFVGTATVPATILLRAKIECGSELFHRRSAPNGIAQFATLDGGQAVRVARDPAIAMYNLLIPYVGLGIA
jgi:energy-converting hydrogenase Eha subunit E